MAKPTFIFLTLLLTVQFISMQLSHANILPWNNGTKRINSEDALGPTELNLSRIEQVSWKPRMFRYKGFLSDEECDHLISLSKAYIQRPKSADDAAEEIIFNELHGNDGIFLQKHQDEVVSRIDRRIAAWTFFPEDHGEPLYIQRYKIGVRSLGHFDHVVHSRGSYRMATVLIYLSDVDHHGGETSFPFAEGKQQQDDVTLSRCAKTGLAVKPAKGDMLLFFNVHPNATTDTHSFHHGCPIGEGEKWIVNKFIRPISVDKLEEEPSKIRSYGDCIDKNDLCKEWADKGECTKNPRYMVGREDTPGVCRKSCNACPP